MKVFYFLCALMLCASLSRGQSTWFVDASNTGTQNGQAWSTAFADLQDAIDAASPGDSIFVESGTYYPTSMLGNGTSNRDKAFLLKSGVLIYGGFTGSENFLSERSQDSVSLHLTNATILSGDLGTLGDSVDNAYHVVVSLLDAATTVLDGFTIRDGYCDDTTFVVAGGLIVDRNYGAGLSFVTTFPTLRNLVVRDNVSTRGGAGMNNFDSDPSIESATFYHNRVWGSFSQDPNGGGAGMRNDASHPAISDAHFFENETHTNQGGGGIRNENGSNPVLTNVLFAENYAEDGDGGAGMYCASGSSPILNECVFRDNETTDQGGGMYNDSSIPYLTDVLFEGNFGGGGAGAMENDASSDVDMTRVQFIDNSTWENGGAIQNWKSSPSMVDVLFEGNHADGDGGALYNYNECSPWVTNTIIRNNTCDGYGGGMYNRRDCNPVLTNVLIHGNYCGIDGGGAYTVTSNNAPCSPVATNVTIVDNEASNSGGGVYDDGQGNTLLRNSIIYGNIALSNDDADVPANMAVTAVYYAIIGDEYFTFGTNPPTVITNTVFADMANEDFHLASLSPAVNTGDSSFYAGSSTPNISWINVDLDSIDRVMGSNIDLGAYEQCVSLATPSVSISVAPGDSVQENTSVTFSSTVTTGGTAPLYQWYKNSIPIAGATASSYTGVANVDFVHGDAFTLWIQSNEQCLETDTAWSDTIVMEVSLIPEDTTDTNTQDSTIHVGSLPTPSLHIYPNPNHGQFVIQGSGLGKGSYQLQVIDMCGRIQREQQIVVRAEAFQTEWILDHPLPFGTYILQLLGTDSPPVMQRMVIAPQ